MGNTDILKKLYLFKDLGSGEIDIIKQTTSVESFTTGDEVFSQGDRAHSLYVVQNGAIKITQTPETGDTIEIARLGPGSHFGEMSFLDGEARSATATAIEPSEIVVIDYDKLSNVMIEHPGIASHFYRQFSLFLCGRLRVTTKDLTFSRSKILTHF